MHRLSGLCGLILLLSCSTSVHAEAILVSAAASLSNAFKEIGEDFQRDHPGYRVEFNFAGSGVLLQQLDRGAPVDVFASADQHTMEQAQDKGLLNDLSRRDFARNSLWLVSPLASQLTLQRLEDLQQPELRRLAVSHPDSVPAGRYARQALQAQGLWAPLQARMVFTQNVRQSLDYVARDEVDAGFVYASDAALMPERVSKRFEVELAEPVLYPIAITRYGMGKEAAERFLQYVLDEPAQATLLRYGFSEP